MENSVAITMPYKYLQKFIAKHPIILLIYIYRSATVPLYHTW